MGTATKVGASVAALVLVAAGVWLVSGTPGRIDDAAPTDGTGASPTQAPWLAAAAPAALSPTLCGEGESAVPPRGAPALEDLTAEDVNRLETEVAPGRVEGIVLRGKEPLGGGRAVVRHETLGSFLDPEFVPGEPAASALIGKGGTFALTDVAPGLYTLELVPEGGASLFASIALPHERTPTRRIVAALGACTLQARVFDHAGLPAAGVTVLAQSSPKRPKVGSPFAARTFTDPAGRYVIGGLPAGPYLVSAYLPSAPPCTDRRDAEVDGAPDGVTTIDLGTDRAEPWWSGVVRGLDGSVVPGPGAIWLWSPGASPYIGVQVPVDADGRFERTIPPGTYEVSVNVLGRLALPSTVSSARRVTFDADRIADVVIPGSRLQGSVRATGSGRPLSGTAGPGERVLLTPEVGGEPARIAIPVAGDGTFTTVGLLPGRCRVTGWPTPVGDTSGRPLAVEVPEGGSEVAVELWTVR